MKCYTFFIVLMVVLMRIHVSRSELETDMNGIVDALLVNPKYLSLSDHQQYSVMQTFYTNFINSLNQRRRMSAYRLRNGRSVFLTPIKISQLV